MTWSRTITPLILAGLLISMEQVAQADQRQSLLLKSTKAIDPTAPSSTQNKATNGQTDGQTDAQPLAAEVKPKDPSPWAGSVELYGFGPIQTTGTTTIRGITADTDLSLSEALSKLKWATSIRGSLEYNRIGLLTDLSYVKLEEEEAKATDNQIITSQAKIRASQGIYDLALRYRFGARESATGDPGQFTVIPYAGIRIVDAKLDLFTQAEGVIDFQKQGTLGRIWVQPLLGTQATVFLSPRLRVFARADIGGFNLSGEDDLSGNAQIGMGYAIGNSTDLNISWRYLGLDFNNSDTPDSGFSSYQNGIEIGVKFFF